MGKTAVEASRGTTFFLPPEDLKVITDPKHPLYDSRVELPVSAALVQSIVKHGFRSVVRAFKDGDKIVVIAGRQRVRAAIEANKLRIAAGMEPVKVEVKIDRGTGDDDLYGQALLENSGRQDDSDLMLAGKIAHYLELGRSEEEAATICGLKPPRVRQLLTLLDLAAPVQRAVEAGKLSTSAASQLAGLERTKQVEELGKLLEESGGKRVRVRQVAVKVKKARGEKTSTAPSRKEIARALEAVEENPDAIDRSVWGEAVADALAWVLGGVRTGHLGAWLDARDKAAAAKPAV